MGIASKNRGSGEAASSPAPAVEQSPGRVTLAKVNAALIASGFEEQLQRGAGYFYFAGGTAELWPRTSVMVSRLGDLSVKEWVAEARDYKEAWDESMGVQGGCS
ncbi:hypothetical protein [Pseudomonas savastanoi]|uniref:hypothetical protein n=1 Tax=Pseudomonas savastanoi TaxID=29438 RepID=UPI001CE26EB9|nr:hypothetical protein [Pseudomonas savastanoi]